MLAVSLPHPRGVFDIHDGFATPSRGFQRSWGFSMLVVGSSRPHNIGVGSFMSSGCWQWGFHLSLDLPTLMVGVPCPRGVPDIRDGQALSLCSFPRWHWYFVVLAVLQSFQEGLWEE